MGGVECQLRPVSAPMGAEGFRLAESLGGGEGGANLLVDDAFAGFEWGEAGHDAVDD